MVEVTAVAHKAFKMHEPMRCPGSGGDYPTGGILIAQAFTERESAAI